MTSHHTVGVDLGTTYSCAAVAVGDSVRVAQLTGTSQTIPSVVSISDDGVIAGEAAERRLVSHPANTVREFKRRFGDPAPIVLGGATYGADVVTGHLLREVLARVEQSEGSTPAAVGLAHPASWGPFRLDLMRSAANEAGIDHVELVPEPVAAAIANRDRVEQGSLIAVYDLGGGTFDAAVVKCEGEWSVVGSPEGVERLGGIDFDQAIMAHVDEVLDGQVFMLDSSEPDTRSALMQLRAECQKAKEHLSQDTDVEIPVSLPSLRTSVRLTRGEFEAMVRPRLADSLSVLDRVVASAGAGWDDISAVLLVGGSSNIPAVGQLVSEHTGRPVMSATNPHLAIAIGTATVAQQHLAQAAPAAAPTPQSAAEPVATPVGAEEQPAPRSSTSFPLVPVLGVVAAVVALAIVAFVVMSGGNDDADEAAIATTAPATGDQADEADDTGEADEADEADDGDQAVATDAPATTPQATATTTADTTERAATNVAVCATDASTVTDLATSNDGMLVAVDGSLRLVDGDAVASCGFDPIAAPPVPGIEPSGVVTWVSATDGAAALSSIDGGSVERRGIGRATCDGLNGPTAMTANDRVLVITGEGGVTALAVDTDGCTATIVVEPADLVATSIAAVGAKVAVLGTDAASGEAVLRLFAQGEGRDVITPDGLGSADAVTGCGGGWCVIDVANDRIVVVADNGSVAGERTLSAGLPAAVTRVVAATKGGDSIYAVVELADGSTPLVRLTP